MIEFELKKSDNIGKLKSLVDELTIRDEMMHKLMMAIDTSHEGIAILDENGLYTYMNLSHETMFNYGVGELIGKSWETIYSDNDVKWFKENVFPVLGEKGKWDGLANAISKDGKIVREHVYLTALKDGGLICTCRNIDELNYGDKQ